MSTKPISIPSISSLYRVQLWGIAILIVALLASASIGGIIYLTGRFFSEQDQLVALGFIFITAVVALAIAREPRLFEQKVDLAFPWVGTIALLIAICAWLGSRFVFASFPLSMDEFWAVADGEILRRGALLAEVPPGWSEYLHALFPTFTRMLGGGSHFASTYLPVNAAMQIIGPLASAGMAAGSVFLVASLGNRLFPDQKSAAIIAALLLASSAQFVVTAMTPYAMTAHLFFNLLWLRAFLSNSSWSHIGAVLVAFLALGLHQPAFFPLFAFPLLVEAFLSGQRLKATLHFVAICTCFLLWLAYEPLAMMLHGVESELNRGRDANAQILDLVARVLVFEIKDVALMSANLLRAHLWQNPITVPLALLGTATVLRAGGPLRGLLGGLILTIGFVWIIIPYQGHGWGYRYLHGLLGNLALLATAAWVWFRSKEGGAEWRGALVGFTIAAIIIFLPLRMWQAHQFTEPYVRADAKIAAMIDTDIVIIDAPNYAFAIDLVRNDPWLEKRPLRMNRASITDAQIQRLCSLYRVSFFGAQDADDAGLDYLDFDERGVAAVEARCALPK